MTEDQILAQKPFAEQPPPPSLKDRATELADAMGGRLMAMKAIKDAIEGLSEDEQARLDADVLWVVEHTLKSQDARMERVAPAIPVPPVSGQPLEPEPEGEVFQVLPGGGLLLSEQKPAPEKA
jgi:hypothetical protein